MGGKDPEGLAKLWEEYLDEALEQMIFSSSFDKKGMLKAKVRPILLGGRLVFQLEEQIGSQAFHKNFGKSEAAEYFTRLMKEQFGRCEIQSEKGWAQVLSNKKGTVTIKRRKARTEAGTGESAGTAEKMERLGTDKAEETQRPEKSGMREKTSGQEKAGMGEGTQEQEKAVLQEKTPGQEKTGAGEETQRQKDPRFQGKIQELSPESRRRLSHNRRKSYLLEEGVPVPFLVDLGVMTREGKIIHAKYDKFRQINRFLEFIDDILPHLSRDRENTIIDFGCGKSYLTFAMYYFLKEKKGYPIQIIGLDLKEEVIRRCNELAQRYQFSKLKFYPGDIASFEGVSQVDMVVTLHACDTATDYALAKAVNWDAKVILSVPCCQHQWNRQMQNGLMKPVLQYGLLKERMAALFTDGIRAEILEHLGYRTQILEFIDMEHTPKNILIRAVKQGGPKDNLRQIQELLEFWQVEPELAKLFSVLPEKAEDLP